VRTPLYGRSQALIGTSSSNSGRGASICTTGLGAGRLPRSVGSSDVPSIVRPARASATSTSVGAKSMFDTWLSTVRPAGTPGPRMMNGTRSDSS
jgi:hypothetical protein